MTCTMIARPERAIHSGGPCLWPTCPFRAPLVQSEASPPTPFADALRAKARELTEELARAAENAGAEASEAEKVAYVRAQAQKASRAHFCHVPECKEPCPPALLMCLPHWRRVPRALRRAVWRAYAPGQEEGRAEVSQAYLDAADAAVAALSDKARAPAAVAPQLTLFGPRGS